LVCRATTAAALRAFAIAGALVVAACVACAPSSAATAPAPAPASGSQSAARAYLRAYREFLGAFAKQTPAVRRAGEAFVAEVSGACPGVLASAPASPARAEMQELAGEALGLAFVAPLRGAAERFAGAVARLDFGEPALERTVRRLAPRDRLEAGLAVPPVCAEAQAWAADGYRALPGSVVAEWHKLKPIVGPSGEDDDARLLRLLGAHATPATRRLLHSVRALQSRVRARLKAIVVPLSVRYLRTLGSL
jgi:hypothetical protein